MVRQYIIKIEDSLKGAKDDIDELECKWGAEEYKPKIGHWTKDISDDPNRTWDRIRFYCSVCNDWNTYGEPKYCPNCGAKMEDNRNENID